MIEEKQKFIFNILISLITGFTFWISIRQFHFFETVLLQTPIPFMMAKGLLIIIQNFLKIFNHESLIHNYTIYFSHTRGIRIIFTCLALSHTGLIIGLILPYPGKISTKLWYIPLTMIVIYLLNALRLIILALVLIYFPRYDEFVHYFFTRIILYLGVFILWYIWIKKFQKTYKKI